MLTASTWLRIGRPAAQEPELSVHGNLTIVYRCAEMLEEAEQAVCDPGGGREDDGGMEAASTSNAGTRESACLSSVWY